jgi:hypothetical protein
VAAGALAGAADGGTAAIDGCSMGEAGLGGARASAAAVGGQGAG